MYTDILREMVHGQALLYEKADRGDYSQVCCSEAKNSEYGTYDRNDTNRLRLSYDLLFERPDCEDMVKKLFDKELEDREHDSFQGIGLSLFPLS